MRGGEDLDDLAADVYETVFGSAAGTADVLLGYSLGALVVLRLCENHGETARRLVLEEPPGSEATDFGEVAREMRASAVLTSGSPEAAMRKNPRREPRVGRRGRQEQRRGHARLRRRDRPPGYFERDWATTWRP